MSSSQTKPDYSQFIKKLSLPPGFAMPRQLRYEDLRLHALTRADIKDEVAGINASLEIIRKTRGGSWPDGPIAEDFNFIYDAWHELEFAEGDSFTYVVRDAASKYLGCCYFYPMGRRKPLTEALLPYDVDISWWVTPEAYGRGFYTKLYQALQLWLRDGLPFKHPYYSNQEMPEA